MNLEDQHRAALADAGRVLLALERYKEHVILVGGLAPVVYRALPFAAAVQQPAMHTHEGDLSIPLQLPVVGTPAVQLLEEAGFGRFSVPSLRRGQPGPVRFQHSRFGLATPAPIYVEFIAPLVGRESSALAEPQSRLFAQRVRFADLFAFHPIEAQLASVPEFAVTEAGAFRISHPAMFILQKVLARPKRPPNKQASDLARVYDVALLARSIWDECASVVEEAADEAPHWKKWIQKAEGELKQLFGSATATGAQEVFRAYSAVTGAPTAEGVSRAMLRFCDQVMPRP